MTCTMLEQPFGSYGLEMKLAADDFSKASLAATCGQGLGMHYGLDMASFVAAGDLKKALGLQPAPIATDGLVLPKYADAEGARKIDGMSQKLVLAEPRKVPLEALSYLSPVPDEGKLTPEFCPPPGLCTSNTVILFDWDDTLLCTSWLCKHMAQNPTPELDKLLRKIAQRSQQMLESALRMGHTYIITNSVSGWVEYSAAIWVPELLPTLQKVQIISARDTYQHLFPDDASQWKLQAFLEVRRQLMSVPIENLVVLGDADFEMEAAQAVEGDFPDAHIKTVKFQSQPTVKEHLRQVEVVAEKFERIVKKNRSLKVFLEKKGTTVQ